MAGGGGRQRHRTGRAAFALGLLLALSSAVPAQAAEGETMTGQPLTLERIFASPDLAGAQPNRPRLSPDGTLLAFLRSRTDDADRFDLWARDTRSGEERMLVDSLRLGSGAAISEAERMQRERARIGNRKGIVSYDWAPAGNALLVPLDGDLYLAGLDGSTARLTETEGSELNPEVSPRGGFVSFVRDQNLVVLDRSTGAERIVTPDGGGTVHWGEAEFVAQEEMDRTRGAWWSPDDRLVAVQRFDAAPVAEITRAAIGGDGTTLVTQRYPFAGTPNVQVELHVMRPDGGGRVEVDLGPDPDIYLARVDWAPDGSLLFVQRQSRDQGWLDLLAVDPATGASRVVLSETATTWLNLHNNLRALKDGSLLWWSERSGHGHLYRVRGSDWTPLTEGDWQVRDVIGIDEAANTVWFTGNLGNPLEQHVFRAPLDGSGAPERLTEPGHWHNAVMDRAASRIIVTRESMVQPPQVYLADAAGRRLAWIAENRVEGSHPYAPFRAGHVAPEFGTLPAADGTPLHWYMLRPEGQPGQRHPVFMIHYGGPGAGRQVTQQWNGALEQYLVDRGWIVFAIDNRGTPDRGKAFEDHLHRAMGTVEVADQLAGLDWLKRQPFVDADRVATYGWSYGGYLTLKLLQAAPGAFAAGIAGAPVTDWALYDTHYTERYLGMPQAGDTYARAGALADAAKIRDPLLLIHGLSDDNVVPDHSTRLMHAMQEANVPFELMLYPGQTHRVSGPRIGPHLWGTMLDFLARRGVAPE